MKKLLTILVVLAASWLLADNSAPKMAADNENPTKGNLAARELFHQRGFGLFVHYGLYSQDGLGEWLKYQDLLESKKYFADRVPNFKPKKGCIDEWIKLAKDAGMRYVVLTTRHHEGFWLGDDFIREYTTKVREAGLGVGVYYSVADWSDPAYRAGSAKDPEGWKRFVNATHAQLRHLMSDFGKIEYLFYDGCPPPAEWDLAVINAEMRRLQPQLLICRGGADCDFKSCEGSVAFDGAPLWEACYTLNNSWGYNKYDFAFKPLPETADMLFSIRHNGGNFLLNVGPMADGTVQKEVADRLRALGKWVKANEEAIFDVVPHPFNYAPRELLVGGRTNRHVAYWMNETPRCRAGRVLTGISNKVNRVTFLASGKEIGFVQDNSGLTPKITFPDYPVRKPGAMPDILKIEFEGDPVGIFNEHTPKYAGNRKDFTIAKIEKSHKIKSQDKFYGFDRIMFDFMGYNAWIVFPKDVPVKGNPWTWCMQWPTAFVPRTNVPQLLADGYHHVTLETFDRHMDAKGLEISAAFQKYLVEELGFAPKANLIGLSWGGFFSVRYAAAYPENVRKIYLDAPLLTFTTGRVDGVGTWKGQRPADGNWLSNPEMPVNKAELVAKAGIPVLLLYGGQDETVPPETSAELFATRFRAAGGDIKVVRRNLFGHHPHGVEESETLIKDFFESDTQAPVASFPGEVNAKSGWKIVANEKGKVVYIPFEGYYESKGGRIESPRFKLDKPYGENGYYRLDFSAKSDVDGYWWVDFYDKDGNLLPDVNSRLYASKDWRAYDVMVPAHPFATEAVVAFVSEKGAHVKDVTLRRADVDEVVAWCENYYSTLPYLDYAVDKDSWAKAPNAKTALKVAKEYTVVLLGDSIMNDSYCGMFTALAQKAFPDTKIRFVISVRGSTGCWYYHEKDHFGEYVAKYKPDLVIIGGISNYLGPNRHTFQEAEDDMVETIGRCKAIGAEVIVCTPPPSYEFRTSAEAKPFDRALLREGATLNGKPFTCLEQEYERRAVARTGVQLWDLTVGPCETIARSGKPLDWFKRDGAHNDDRGKQLIAQMFGEYFRAAYR